MFEYKTTPGGKTTITFNPAAPPPAAPDLGQGAFLARFRAGMIVGRALSPRPVNLLANGRPMVQP